MALHLASYEPVFDSSPGQSVEDRREPNVRTEGCCTLKSFFGRHRAT